MRPTHQNAAWPVDYASHDTFAPSDRVGGVGVLEHRRHTLARRMPSAAQRPADSECGHSVFDRDARCTYGQCVWRCQAVAR